MSYRRLKLVCLYGIALLGLQACLGSDDEDQFSTTPLLASVDDLAGETDWLFSYEDCRLVQVDMYRLPGGHLPPAQYTHPLGVRGAAESITFGYNDDDQLISLVYRDSLAPEGILERPFSVQSINGLVTNMTMEQPLANGMPSNRPRVNITYTYNLNNRIDSIVYSSGRSVQFFRNQAGRLTQANYRNSQTGATTEEFYSVLPGATNPLARIPLRYLLTYAAYWTEEPVQQSTFDLREFNYSIENGLVTRIREVTFLDSTDVSFYNYENVQCF